MTQLRSGCDAERAIDELRLAKNVGLDQLGVAGSVEISHSTAFSAIPAIKKVEKKAQNDAHATAQKISRKAAVPASRRATSKQRHSQSISTPDFHRTHILRFIHIEAPRVGTRLSAITKN
jgi:hypothetical protein